MNIATFTDHLSTPSSRFRVRQYFPYLEDNGIYVHDFYRRLSTETVRTEGNRTRIRESTQLIAKAALHEVSNILLRLTQSIDSNRFDAVWLSRQLIIGYPSFEFLIKSPLIYDIDDAIFLNGSASYYQFKKVSEMASAVIAGNEYLAEMAGEFSRNVFIVPTAVDTNRWHPILEKTCIQLPNIDQFRLGWSGTSSSFQYLVPLQSELKNFLLDFPSAKLLIMSDRFPNELSDLVDYIEYVKWSVQSEVKFIQSLDVGLMPIKDDLWSKGKCAYKMLLYSSCGIPVIVSPTGANKKILAEAELGFGARLQGEWYESLRILINDRNICIKFGANGVKLVKDRYSLDVCAPKIVKILKNCK
jgi:glycosyltransferase involved in cell wall biosynthesis